MTYVKENNLSLFANSLAALYKYLDKNFKSVKILLFVIFHVNS